VPRSMPRRGGHHQVHFLENDSRTGQSAELDLCDNGSLERGFAPDEC
jgi:hypothetical protein